MTQATNHLKQYGFFRHEPVTQDIKQIFNHGRPSLQYDLDGYTVRMYQFEDGRAIHIVMGETFQYTKTEFKPAPVNNSATD